MDKQKQQLVVLGILVLVLVIFLANAFMPKKKKTSKPAPAAAPSVFVPPPLPPQAQGSGNTGYARATPEETKAQQVTAEMPWKADPFYHALSKEIYQNSNLVLKGVSTGPGRRNYATINSEIVTVGDYIFGYKVEEISRDRVLLKRETESYYLVWPEQ